MVQEGEFLNHAFIPYYAIKLCMKPRPGPKDKGPDEGRKRPRLQRSCRKVPVEKHVLTTKDQKEARAVPQREEEEVSNWTEVRSEEH